MWVFNDGTNVVEVQNFTSVSSGGTGASTLTANNVILGNGTSAVQFVAPGTSGNLLTSNGTTWTSAASPFVTGMIMLWSGSIASIPSGWALCDGTSGTPNLEDRFVVGAGNTYAVNATGGSADAIVVSHTHTASASTVSNHQHALFANADTGTSALTALNEANYRQQGGNNFLEYFIRGSSTAATLGLSSAAGSHTHTITVDTQGSSGTNANMPPYYALAYIMNL
jgi:microcystin-dependent protein